MADLSEDNLDVILVDFKNTGGSVGQVDAALFTYINQSQQGGANP
jgi:hypothetical protein